MGPAVENIQKANKYTCLLRHPCSTAIRHVTHSIHQSLECPLLLKRLSNEARKCCLRRRLGKPGCRNWAHVTSGCSRRLHAQGLRKPEERSTRHRGTRRQETAFLMMRVQPYPQKLRPGKRMLSRSDKLLTVYGGLALVRAAGPPNITEGKTG
jgi:hypothetical protein